MTRLAIGIPGVRAARFGAVIDPLWHANGARPRNGLDDKKARVADLGLLRGAGDENRTRALSLAITRCVIAANASDQPKPCADVLLVSGQMMPVVTAVHPYEWHVMAHRTCRGPMRGRSPVRGMPTKAPLAAIPSGNGRGLPRSAPVTCAPVRSAVATPASRRRDDPALSLHSGGEDAPVVECPSPCSVKVLTAQTVGIRSGEASEVRSGVP
jgi:hypothetical protein